MTEAASTWSEAERALMLKVPSREELLLFAKDCDSLTTVKHYTAVAT